MRGARPAHDELARLATSESWRPHSWPRSGNNYIHPSAPSLVSCLFCRRRPSRLLKLGLIVSQPFSRSLLAILLILGLVSASAFSQLSPSCSPELRRYPHPALGLPCQESYPTRLPSRNRPISKKVATTKHCALRLEPCCIGLRLFRRDTVLIITRATRSRAAQCEKYQAE